VELPALIKRNDEHGEQPTMKRALLIGINAYISQRNLNGCVNDIEDMAGYLVNKQGFASDDIRLVADERATADGIRERVAWLVKGVSPGDTVMLHYSGHGTLFPVRDAAGKVTAVHGSICPVDFDWTVPHAIFETELREAINKTPKDAEFIFVSDSCHSGNLTREMKPGEPKFRPRGLVPPVDIAWRLKTARDLGIKPTTIEVHDNCGFISGCKEDQTSADADFGARSNGALTYYLLQNLGGAGGSKAVKPLIEEVVRPALAGAGFDQEPQVHGPDAVLGRAFLASK
jgi:hypothetical protein